jgi:hypothetical protein
MSEYIENSFVEDDEDQVILIPESDRTTQEEEKVTYYLNTYKDVLKRIGMPEFRINKKKYKRVEMPAFSDERKRRLWEEEEIKRCRKGHDGMSGRMYFYFNYGWIQNIEKGKLAPQYRVCQDEWFSFVDKTQQKTGEGIVCVKRRRIGASWMEAADALYDVIFTPFFVVGMNSKSVTDSRILFDKVKFMFDNLPQFLRVRVGSKTKDQIDFFYEVKDDLGNKIRKGNQSSIVCRAPSVTAFEGMMLNKWICDESGKQSELPQMWSFTEDTMMQETKRMGMPVLFGTSGEIGRDGAGLKSMWDNAEIHKLRRWFFAGYMGLAVDEYGNDRIEDTIRWIVYERKRRKGLSIKAYYDFLQRYPLTIGEAFAQTSEGGLGNIVKITNQMDELDINPPKATRGGFSVNREGQVVFKPNELGDVIIYEHAKKGMEGLYISGADPVDHNTEFPESGKLSKLSMYIMRKPHGTSPPRIVAQYTARPKMVNDYYQQAIMMLQYYNNCKVLIEKNRARMIAYFDEHGFKYLLHHAPQGIVKLVGGKSFTIGITMTKAMKDYLVDLCEEYIDDHCQWIPDKDLLQEFLDFGTMNTDRVMAFGLALMLLKEDKTVARKGSMKSLNLPGVKWVNRGGKIVKVGRDGQVLS